MRQWEYVDRSWLFLVLRLQHAPQPPYVVYPARPCSAPLIHTSCVPCDARPGCSTPCAYQSTAVSLRHDTSPRFACLIRVLYVYVYCACFSFPWYTHTQPLYMHTSCVLSPMRLLWCVAPPRSTLLAIYPGPAVPRLSSNFSSSS